MSTDPPDGGGHLWVYGNPFDSVGYLLFDSLVHQLIEKGVLTKNDALSVVQSAAQVVHGRMQEVGSDDEKLATGLSMLERIYSSFQALPDRYRRPGLDGHNVRRLRPPLHGDRPHFPSEDD